MLHYATPVSRFLLNCFLFSSVTLLAFSSVRAQTVRKFLTPPTSASSQVDTAREHIPADLSKDTRLNRRISLHEVGTPFNTLLKKISVPDLTLTVETDSAEQKLHINIKERSIRELMQGVAELFPGDWYAQPDGNGYRYEMNIKSARRRRRWWELFLSEREKAFAAIRVAILQDMRTPMPRPARFVTDHEHEDGVDEATWRAMVKEKAVFNTLPVALQEQIAGQIIDTALYDQRGSFTSSEMQEGALLFPLTAFPDEMRQRFGVVPKDGQGNARSEEKVYVRFSNFGWRVEASFVTIEGKYLRSVGTLSVTRTPDMIPISLNQTDLPKEVKKRGKEAPLAWRELAAFQQSRVWPNDLPKSTAKRERPNRIEMQEALVEKEGVEFVSDYYTARDVTNVQPEKLTRPLKEELDWEAQAQDMSWKQEAQSGLYLFRSNRWYRDDLLEIPAPILQRWMEYRKRQIALELERNKQGIKPTTEIYRADFLAELDWIADFVTALTPWQLFNGLANVVVSSDALPLSGMEQAIQKVQQGRNNRSYPRRPFDQDRLGIQALYHTLVFYGSLSHEERVALLAGRIDANSLMPALQQQARYILPALQVISPPRAGEPLWLRIEIGPDGGWTGLPPLHLVLSSLSPALKN